MASAEHAAPAPRGALREIRGLSALIAMFAISIAALSIHDLLHLGGSAQDSFASGLYCSVMVIATASVFVRAIVRPRERVAWLLLALGLLSWTAAEIYWSVALGPGAAPSYPSLADIGFLAFYPLAYASFVLLVHARVGELQPAFRVDGLIAGLATAASGAAVIFDIAQRAGSSAPLARTIAYPLGDMLLVAFIVVIVAMSGWRPSRTWSFLLLGVAFTAIPDSVYAVHASASGSIPWRLLEPMWVLSAALIALAAWQPAKPTPRPAAALHGWRGVIAPALIAALTLTLLGAQWARPTRGLTLELIGATVLAIILRLASSLNENQRLLAKLTKDFLTGLGNRSALESDLKHTLDEADQRAPSVLLLFDLDGFKLYNDTFGHPAGDVLLRRLGHQLSEAVGDNGAAYRLGGDEFCVLLNLAGEPASRTIARASEALCERGAGFEVTSSWGSVVLPDEARDGETALQIADRRMYEQKEATHPSAGRQVEQVLMRALEASRPDLGEHCHRVASLAHAVGERLGLSNAELAILRRAAELHDLGKMAIPDSILAKKGPLDAEERDFIERHTELGALILSESAALKLVAPVVRSSHERFDGTGYPDRLAGEEIPIASRIVFACDALHAMCSTRPYSAAVCPEEGIKELRRCAGSQFDPAVVEALCQELESRTQQGDASGASFIGNGRPATLEPAAQALSEGR